MTEEKLINIDVAIQSFKVDNSFTKTAQIFDTPSDKELGITINKLLHDYKSDFIIIRRIERIRKR